MGDTEAEDIRLEDLVRGYQKTQVLHVAARLGLADLLAAGPRSAEELAGPAGADPRALYRLLRALAVLGVVHELRPGRFALTPFGRRLRAGAPGGAHEELLLTGDAFYRWWGALEHSVRTGESSVPGIEGASSFEWMHRRPEQVQRFNRLMSEMIGAMARAILAAYDFGGFGTVVDVGGGRGTLLAAILEAHPAVRGVLFDLPATADEARPLIAARGLAERCTCVRGDFFAGVPTGDAILLSAIVSDWDDERSVALLAQCRRALPPDGRLLLVERLLVPDEPAPPSAFMDLQMLVIGGGTGRSEAEYRALLAAAGFDLLRVIPTRSPRSLFEARPRP
jgi:SAM-dependent methyltransferase